MARRLALRGDEIEPRFPLVACTQGLCRPSDTLVQTTALWHGAVASRAKIVIVETDPALPYVHVLDLTPGNVVTAPRSDMMFVVTEYGLVNLKGKSIPERAKAMILLAHPDFREDLEREARANGLIPRSFA